MIIRLTQTPTLAMQATIRS